MNSKQKQDILKDWFGYTEDVKDLKRHEEFFRWIEDDVDFKNDGSDEADAVRKLELATAVIKYIRRHPKATREEIKTELKPLVFTGEAVQIPAQDQDTLIDAAINRAVRLWLRVYLVGPGDPRNLNEPSLWNDGSNLSDFVRGAFYPRGVGEDMELPTDLSEIVGIQSRLTHRLTVANIVEYTDIDVQPTKYFQHHLEYNANTNVLYVFLNKRWLLDAEKLAEQANGSELPIDKRVITETIKSLDYLFPAFDSRTQSYLMREENEHINLADENGGRRGDRPSIKEFAFYHERLMDIAYEFTNPPRDLKSIWKDRRNPVQFFIFWIVLLIFIVTVVFGVVASVLAGLQLGAALNLPSRQANSG
ncbi:hypothetical protein O1611_g9916 [Lasiodiplodia mahajangana]|uniref:Uncharacterized protein n=1 Tax=Lasiodiplodia mahajangana TaxID=1108764 RepID=A0ACC2J4L7_9PEZI|nr:hypothetical protein O1611_g9916 [Lasiodiplodia mahajangana]